MKRQPIGVFDSGAGGISTLKKLSELMPNENFIFFGDSLHAPYGNKSTNEVYHLSKIIMDYFISKNVKAVVIACNTATSAAKEKLVIDYPKIPIIGIEPALKEAVDNGERNILVLGTELTINLPKYRKMVNNYITTHNIYSVVCSGLAEYIESGLENKKALNKLLELFLGRYKDKNIEGIVLGCTHYPFVETEIRSYFSSNVHIHTGYQGVAKQLEISLQNRSLINPSSERGEIIFMSSKKEAIGYYKQLFEFLNQ